MNAALQAWQARLLLRFQAQSSRTILASRSHVGPLVVQRPFHPEGSVCHVYLVHPPGGIVGGDDLALTATLEPGAQVLITTPAATRFYRSGPHPRALLQQQLEVRDAQLEWLPQETILFDGARARSRTEVRLAGDSRFIGWEIFCLGRPASNEAFTSGELLQDLLLWRDGNPLYFDRLRLTGGSPCLDAPWGLAGARAFGSLVALPADQSQLDELRRVESPGVNAALTLLDGMLACRATAASAELLRLHFIALWTRLRPTLLRRFAVPPRIWTT